MSSYYKYTDWVWTFSIGFLCDIYEKSLSIYDISHKKLHS